MISKTYLYKKYLVFKDYLGNYKREEEEEVVQLTDGMCFGDWGLLDKVERAASAYSLETTDLFMLNTKDFATAFQVS